ncbi:hypothetical protein FA15DRAFT_671423 [Coprinopsis marcescibilis]|uniref:Uncharacterized protein n=1 Tax=Coprinopsis marcescibilis TaxID=230819 RepID=A0A5C3KPQ9_COPMA|nr:hypothetical protein FA15DRAFT_671423 [Coprinopsis marcescibilis]
MRTPLSSDSTNNLNLSANTPQSLMLPPAKPPMKRRRLGSSTSPVITTTAALPLAKGLLQNLSINKGATTGNGMPTCVSCHRVLLGTHGGPVSCARCSALTCTICSRTCTSCAPSQPPTPHLTFSPSPSPSPVLQSPMPRRSVLGTHTANINQQLPPFQNTPGVLGVPAITSVNSDIQMASQEDRDQNRHSFPTSSDSTVAGKRRKAVDIQDRDEEDLAGKTGDAAAEERAELGYGPGCGRVLCKDCCFENVHNSTTTCYDCYGSY